MKKIILIFIAIVSITFSMQAQNESKTTKVRFEVDGVCQMCKTRIEKAAALTKGVKYAIWNVETKELYCIYNNKKTTVLKIKQALADVGHDTKEIKATDEVYSQIDDCCKYRNEEIKKH